MNARVKKDESFGAKRIPKRSVSFERRSWLRYDVRLAARLEGLRKRSVVEPFTNRSSSVTPQRWDVQISTGRHLPVWNLSLLSSKLFSNSQLQEFVEDISHCGNFEFHKFSSSVLRFASRQILSPNIYIYNNFVRNNVPLYLEYF